MSIANIAPAANAFIQTGDSFSCEITHTGATEVEIRVAGETAWTLTAGAAAGFEINKNTLSEVTTISVKRTAGWTGSPIIVDVEVTGGAEAGTTSWSYYVGTSVQYPQGKRPYNEEFVTDFVVSKDDAEIASGVRIIDVDGSTMNVVKTGSNKIKLFSLAGGGGGGGIVGPIVYESGGTLSAPSAGAFRADAVPFFTSVLRFDDDGTDGELRGFLLLLEEGNTIFLKDDTNGELFAGVVSTVNDTGTDVTIALSGVVTADAPGDWTNGRSYTVGAFGNNAFILNILKSGQLSALTDIITLADDDVFLVEDQSAAFGKKKASGALLKSYILAAVSGQKGLGVWQCGGIAGGVPSIGEFTVSSAFASSALTHNINDRGADAAFLGGFMQNLPVGTRLLYQDTTDLTQFATYKISAVVDNGTYVTYTIDTLYDTDITFVSGRDYNVFLLPVNASVAGGSGGGMGQWDYASGGGAPGSTQITANVDLLSGVTTLNISDASGSDNNFSAAFANVKVGDYIVIRDNAGGGAHGTFLVSNAVDNATYWTYTVTPGNVAGSFSAGNTYDMWVLSGESTTETEVNLVGVASTQNELNDGWDGSTIETSDVGITSNGTIWTCTVEQSGGGDIRFRYGGETFLLDCTPAASVTLTTGTDVAPVANYIFIDGTTKLLTANTAGFPADSIRIATAFLQSAASGLTDGPFKSHVWTDHVKSSSTGHIADINAKLRTLPATWISGVAPGDLATSVNDAYISSASGTVFQLHTHTFPARDMQTGDPAWLVNDPTTAYKRITTFDDITQDAAGGSINNRHFPLVVWGCVSEDEADCKIFINLPGGTYNSAVNAIADAEGYADYSIPAEFLGTGFLIAKYTVEGKDAGTWVQDEKESLLGLQPSTSPGSGAGGGGGGSFTIATGIWQTNASAGNGSALTQNIRLNSYTKSAITTMDIAFTPFFGAGLTATGMGSIGPGCTILLQRTDDPDGDSVALFVTAADYTGGDATFTLSHLGSDGGPSILGSTEYTVVAVGGSLPASVRNSQTPGTPTALTATAQTLLSTVGGFNLFVGAGKWLWQYTLHCELDVGEEIWLQGGETDAVILGPTASPETKIERDSPTGGATTEHTFTITGLSTVDATYQNLGVFGRVGAGDSVDLISGIFTAVKVK